MKDIIKSPEDSCLLIKDDSDTINNEAKEQESGFLAMILCTEAAAAAENVLKSQGIITTDEGTINKFRIFNTVSSLK